MAISSDIFDGVDLSRLPAPQVIEPLDFATIRLAVVADLVALYPDFSALTPADPAVKVLDLMCYRELLLRARVNDAALAVMLPFAAGADLDQIGARVNLERYELVPADPLTGTAAVLESDADFRARIQRAPEGWSVAGPVGAYVSLAKKAHAQVRIASCISPAPCQVLVTVQSYAGAASPDILAAVYDYLNADDRRPLTDQLTVQSATILPYVVHATIRTFSGPSAALIIANARARLIAWQAENELLGRDVTLDAIHAQLRVEGVSKVTLTGWADVVCNETQAAHCTEIVIVHDGAGE